MHVNSDVMDRLYYLSRAIKIIALINAGKVHVVEYYTVKLILLKLIHR